MKNVREWNIGYELANEIEIAKSCNYEINIKLGYAMFEIVIKSPDNMISNYMVENFKTAIRQKLNMRLLMFESIEHGIILTFSIIP